MKYFILYFLFACFGNSSYLDPHNFEVQSSEEFEFIIKGTVDGLDGIVLSLYIPSQGLDARIKTTISNGEYIFMGRASEIELAEIRFEENIISKSSTYSTANVIIEKGTTVLNFSIQGEPMLRYITDHQVEVGSRNIFYCRTNPILKRAGSTWIFGDSIRMDSMIRYEYPKVREKVIQTYSEICSDQLHDEVCLIYLHNITLGFKQTGAFNSQIMPVEEKEKVKDYIYNVNDSLKNMLIYNKTKINIDNCLDNEQKTKFTEYKLDNISRKKSSLTKIIETNNYTILYFWWSGCGPCRKFNRENQKHYSSLKQRGIEIVSINIDESKEQWIKSSHKDNIQWINLYAGKNTLITNDYKVNTFPTKLVYDREGVLVDFDFKNLDEFSYLE